MSRRRILKFVVEAAESTEIRTVEPPVFLAVGAQGDTVVVWAEAAVGDAHLTWLVPVMTGQEPPAGARYVGTAQVGPIVVHVYAR